MSTEEIDVDAILNKIDGYFGYVPKIFQVLSENPPALKAYFEKMEILLVNSTLSPLTKEYISIGAAAALGAEHCLATHLEVARKLGANDEEIMLATLIGASIAETNALASSLRVYDEFKD